VTLFGYCAKMDFNKDKNSILASYNPLHPFEKWTVGLIGRPSRRLHVLAELKGDQMNNCETTFGFRTKFSGGSLTGTIGMNGKATSTYRHSVDFFELGFQTQMNFARPQ
jgi:hypothetical protein